MYIPSDTVYLIPNEYYPNRYLVAVHSLRRNTIQKRKALVDRFNQKLMPYLKQYCPSTFAPERDKCFLPTKSERQLQQNQIYVELPDGVDWTPKDIQIIENLLITCLPH